LIIRVRKPLATRCPACPVNIAFITSKSEGQPGRLMFFSMVGFVALGVAISLLFVYYGWTPVDFVAP
jgi:hypothetical protein